MTAYLKQKISCLNIKKIVLLSDAADGQNKNVTVMMFCSWYAYAFGLQITQMFPVRGHSFGQCDRNFDEIRYKETNRD